MGYNKVKKTNPDINPPKIGDKYLQYGMDRIEQLLAFTDKKTNFLPRNIDQYDIDESVNDFIKNKNMKLILDGKDVPVIYLSNERWAEFSKTWQYVDLDKNLLTPFITVVRSHFNPSGTRLGKRFNYAQNKVFGYMDVPINDEGQLINLRFKIPQPINVDLTYDVRLFTKYQKDVNVFDKLVAYTFASRQAYIWVKGNPMPVVLENSAANNTVQDVKGDRMYVQQHTIKVLGFTQSEEHFKIVKTTRLPNLEIGLKR